MTDVVHDTKAKITKLDLHEGDTLVVMVPQVLTAEARILYVRFMRDNLPPGVKCMVLDGGVTLDKLKREHEAEVDSAAYRAAFSGGLRIVEDYGSTSRTWIQRVRDQVRRWVDA